jgi:site-specific DNA recombinase
VDVAAGKPGRRGTGGSMACGRAPWRAGHSTGCADACGASERRTTISRTGSADPLDRLTTSRDQEDIAALFKRLRFLGVRLVTVSEGEIGDLHIGLKGAMNALYLKDLADKTRRGLEGRVRAGRSGGGLCYGYDVVPGEERGGRTINAGEAAIVRRIFTEFAAGRSPKAIARRLSDDGIPGPRGILWRDTAIRGHRQRGTGILNNELYIGRLVWNRLRYVKDPASGRRVSRLAAPAPSAVRLHPRLADDYREKVAELGRDLADPKRRTQAVSQLRNLIAHVELRHDGAGWMVELQGELEALVALGLAK